MLTWNRRRLVRRITAFARRWRLRALARPLDPDGDEHVDAALQRAGRTRADLFTPAGAIARHRVRMAYMLAAHDIDVRRAVLAHWDELKVADRICAGCRATARCRNWLEAAGREAAPPIFCPNARLFETLAVEPLAPGAVHDARPARLAAP